MKILIFGLPGSGKTTFAKKLIKDKDLAYFNADEIRTIFNDWDFTEQGRVRQFNRMLNLCNMAEKNSVVDFVCPYDKYRDNFDITIWLNTITKSRFNNTNKVFEKPKKFDYEITNYDYEDTVNEIRNRL